MAKQPMRRKLIDAHGGSCEKCGYNRSTRALHFHHTDASEKYAWDASGRTSLREVAAHPERFQLLCANCHAEAHDQLDEARAKYIPCEICGDPIRVAEYLVKSRRKKYCSYQCRDIGRFAHSSAPSAIKKRLMRRVRRQGECWVWTGQLSRGIPVIGIVPEPRKPHMTTVPRLAYELYIGEVPDGSMVIRSCQTPTCVNPHHYVIGDHAEKMRQASLRGSTTRGEKSASSKLTADTVREIRAKYAAGNTTQRELAAEYGLHQAYVSELVLRKKWAHLD